MKGVGTIPFEPGTKPVYRPVCRHSPLEVQMMEEHIRMLCKAFDMTIYEHVRCSSAFSSKKPMVM